ncbi:MAG: hypothetical protein HUU20_07730 [Pirellulales bacterium]|nr:hypothetical protein [Pirellulales bacterium]
MPIPLEQRIARYHQWRLRQDVERPMIGLIWEPDIPPLPEFLARVGSGAEVSPDEIDPELFFPAVERWHRHDAELTCDTIQRFTPAFGIPWMEAIAGCRVIAKPGSLWAEPCLESYQDRPSLRLDAQNPWLRTLVAFTRAMVERSAGRFPVAVPQMRGPLDVLAAMRTPEQMCIDLVEQPEEVRTVLGELADLWIGVGRAVLDRIPPFRGGYMGRMGMWAPGPAITPQNDVSTLLSPRTYAQFGLPGDRKIVENFPFTEYHMHSTEHRHVDALLGLERLTAIEFTLEHTLGGPALGEMLPVARRILDRKPLVLAAPDIDTAERCLAELPARGLCLTLATSGHCIPLQAIAWLREHRSC